MTGEMHIEQKRAVIQRNDFSFIYLINVARNDINVLEF